MKALIVHSSSPDVRKLAELMAEELQTNNIQAQIEEVIPLKQKRLKKKEMKFKPVTFDWNGFDLVFVGVPVIGFGSSKAINNYLRKCQNLSGRRIGLFIVCIGLHGNAVKKMTSIINFHGGKVKDYTVISSFLGLNEKKLNQAREFTQKMIK
ncbi:MAG: hypothetical protein ABIE23_01565 [archaeon]